MKQLTKIGILFVAFFVLSANKCKDKMPDKTNSCKEVGEVIDMTGLDGCGLMIEMKDEKFEPVSWPDGFTPKAGTKISFSFTEATDMASICMAGKMINVTCAEVLD